MVNQTSINVFSFSIPIHRSFCYFPSILTLHNRRLTTYPRHLRFRYSSGTLSPPPVEVICIGSRKDALIDFLLSNPLISTSPLRFWTVHKNDSQKVQLLQRCTSTDMIFKEVEFQLSLRPNPPAVILVASAGIGVDYMSTMEILSGIKSAGGLIVSILLKPFSFEGQRRLAEVNDLSIILRKCSHLLIDVEVDSLLKEKMETLAEALDNTNNAVFLAINTVSTLMSGLHSKSLSSHDGHMKNVESSEVLNILETHGEARVGFGSDFNMKSAISQAAFHCPFLCGELKGFKGAVFFTLSSSCHMEEHECQNTILNFREITEFYGDIIFSRIYEPKLEQNLNIATLLVAGYKVEPTPRKKTFLSGLALKFSLLSSFLGKHLSEPSDKPFASESMPSYMGISDPETSIKDNEKETYFQESIHCDRRIMKDKLSDVSCESVPNSAYETTEDDNEQGSNCNIGPAFHIAQLWAKEQSSISSNNNDMIETFILPVGVKSSDPCSNCAAHSEATLDKTITSMNTEYNLKGRNFDDPRKRGHLSERAASMLESERESQKRWTPNLELQYRGGTYRGQCQGGLPEGKGSLTFGDGSFYDGMWRNGKRSGLGTFCFSNGDVYYGLWRDDFMHGKGWLYFHSGDRWFANFWKGKANGEGRFYSNDGCIFFGHFQDGWRHGEGTYIDIGGLRWSEVWKEGVLISKYLAEKEAKDQPATH